LIEPRILGNEDNPDRDQRPVATQLIRKHYTGTIIVAGGFTGETAEDILQSGDADLVAFGRDFIANPDLPERLRHKLPLNVYDRPSFFGGMRLATRIIRFISRLEVRFGWEPAANRRVCLCQVYDFQLGCNLH
jgi:2,4-dienoyl-CoA reductase-like NADH-dependent reductase (Old Yellow Enzyme family)